MVGMIKESERNWRPRLVFGKKRTDRGHGTGGRYRACQSCLAVVVAAAAAEAAAAKESE